VVTTHAVRRFITFTVLFPAVLGGLALWAIDEGWLHTGYGVSALALATIVGFVAAIVALSRSMEASEAQRDRAEAELRRSAELTAALARAGSLEEVASAVIEYGLPALEGSAGALLLVTEDGRALQVVEAVGYSPEKVAGYRRVPIEAKLPMTEAARTARPVFVRSLEELRERFVPLDSVHRSFAAIPLRGRDSVLGVLALSYATPQLFEPRDVERLSSLALHCGQAIDRARLYEADQRAQQRATQAMERLHAALAAAAIGTYTWSLVDGVVQLDQGVRSILGFDGVHEGRELEVWGARVHPDDRAAWQLAQEAARRSGQPLDHRYRVVRPDGVVRWVLDKGRVVHDGQGRPLQLTGGIVDLTAEHTAREDAERASRAKDEFLAMLSHELRNPLSPILTSLELMSLHGPQTFVREREVIARQVEHMMRLIDDLLDVARITRGALALRKKPLELGDAATKAIELASPLLEQKRQSLRVTVPRRGLMVDADEGRLTQVVSNLLTNAAKYTDAGGHIELAAYTRDGRVYLAVSDDGMGIAPALLPRIFEPFVQGERTMHRSRGGLGLGLAIAHNIVALHDGTITVSSDGPGRGSTFTVSLPVSTSVHVAVETPTSIVVDALRVPPRARRVLVVDDNEDAATLLADALRGRGHVVETAFDGPTAVERARVLEPELVFLDLGLPVMDGFEVAHTLRALPFGARLMLVAVTGYGQDVDRARTREAGFDRHLVKPVELEQTMAIVNGLGAA
jgi:PAS domain S-box-containing protein